VPAEQAAVDLLLAANASVVSFNMSEADVEFLMRQPWTMSSSDGGLGRLGEGVPHPRRYGAFPRKLARYVRERAVVGLEFAIRSMTSLPAAVFGFADRGVLRPGAIADVVLFDLAKVQDTATYERPHQLAEGVALVVVNGTVLYEDGRFTDAMPGRVLRK
jgi:N-acyl-D-aspartate/D-glutamate deacylase